MEIVTDRYPTRSKNEAVRECDMPSFRSCGAAEADSGHCTVPLWGGLLLLEGAIRGGVPQAELLRRLAVPSDAQPDPQRRITLERFARVLRWASRRQRDELAGLWRRPVPIGSFAMVVGQMVQCPTLGSALRLGLRMYKLLAPGFPLRSRRDGSLVWLEIARGQGGSVAFDITCVYWVLCTLRWLAERAIPVRQASVSIGACDSRYSEPQPFLEVETAYGMPSTGVAIEASWLNRPIARGAADVQRFLRAAPANLLRSTSDHPSVELKVRSHLEQQMRSQPLTGLPALEAVALRLAISPRALRRRLQAEGVNFLQLRESCLRDMAIQWVAHSELPLVDVGVRMGFSDSSTFHRAFKRWTGSAPGEYRRAGGLPAGACAVPF